jgi:hypothetical protein
VRVADETSAIRRPTCGVSLQRMNLGESFGVIVVLAALVG